MKVEKTRYVPTRNFARASFLAFLAAALTVVIWL